MAGYTDTVNLQINAIGNFSNVIGEVNKLQSRLQNLKLPKNLGDESARGLTELQQKFQELQNLANKGIKTKADFNNFEKAAKEVDIAARQVEKSLNSISDKKIKINMADTDEIKKKIQELEQFKKEAAEIANLKAFNSPKATGIFNSAEIDKIKNSFSATSKGAKYFQDVINGFNSGKIDKATASLEKFLSYAKQYEKTLNDSGGNDRGTKAVEWATKAQAAISGADAKIKEFNSDINQMRADNINKMTTGLNNFKSQFSGVHSSIRQTTQEMRNMASSTMNMQSQLGMLRTQADYFFGLQNMIQLFRRGLQDTIQTVKDLDKAMTDTAVVTDMTVSDLWAQLPDYTKLANKLGATTQGAYETMTLYYQQGLNKQETFEIGEETMKMARIAGLDYAQTTNMMTAALRGFNMELNQTSAKRVNDVYSELAAITASDTRELGLAMERTASIAHSANMEFGNTTAFLAQMIETTREAPENLGTAMKTIIARFQELKENPYQISEVEGEEVDFNRVDKALKSIGVDLMDNRDKFRDLDDVFMDISEKWDGLSQTQQRYIATIAAGSRQQSRFLAMVGNYDRLKQLTEAAANSEGASDVQFSKTLESMEAKLNKLHNAWDQFMMGITNSDLIKGMTGVAVKVLDAINKIESGIEKAGDHIGGIFGDIFKSVTSFTALLLGFKGIGKATNIGIGMLGNILGAGKGTGASFFGGATGMRQANNMAQANAISSPIVAAINRLTAVVQGRGIKGDNPGNTRNIGSREFKNRNNQLRSIAVSETRENGKKQYAANRFNVRNFGGVFEDLSIEDQAALYRGQKGTRQAIQRSFSEGIKKLNVSKEASQAADRFYTDLDYAMASGSHQVQEGLTKAFDPVQLGREIGGDTGKEITKAALDRRKQIIKQGQQLHGYKGKDLENYWRTREADLYGGSVKLNENEVKGLTSRMTGLTSTVNGAGSAFMQLGFTLQSLGLEGVGAAISTFGSSLMSVGMMAETAGHGLSVLKKEAASAYAALAGAAPLLIAAGAAFALAFATYKIDQKRIADIRKSGKEVVDAYEETTKSVQENLNKLDKIEPDWNRWSQGVDANGNNINLGTEEYQDYKKAVKEITDMHPELIKGYNAEGEAIVDNSTALKEAIKLEQEREKTATKNYLDEGQKIVDRRNSTKRWQKGESQQLSPSALSHGAAAYSIEKSDIEKDAQKITSAIKEIDGGEELLTKWGVTFDELGNITQEGINILRDHGGDIQNELEKTWENPTEAQQLLLNNSQDAIAQLGEDFKGIEEVSKETFDALKTYATDQGIFENIDTDLVAPFQNALQRISEQDLSWDELKSATDELGKTYQNLGGHAEDFREIQSKVDEAQKEFGQNLDTQAYEKRVKNLTKPMDDWITELRSSSNQADQILADWVENQKARMTDLSKETVELSDAFNVMSGRIASANSAYDNWTSQNEEGDLYTASDNFKKMLEEVNDGVDDLGKGSQQWWTAAQSMFGDEYVLEHSKKEIQSHMNQVKQYLKEGQEGVDNFMIDLRDNKLDKELDEDILGVKKNGAPYTIGDFIKVDDDGALNFDKLGEAPDEAFTAIAQALGMSDDLLTSLMNKARQFGDIKFGNVDQMRTALAASDSTIVGNGFTNGNKNIYVKESDFDTQALEALGSGDEVKEYKKDLEKLGTVFMDAASSINKGELSKYIQDWGIKTDKYQTKSGEERFQTTADAFIRYFDKAGYNKDEIQQMYETATSGKKSLITDADKIDFNEAYQTAKEKNADPSFQAVTSIEGNVSGILSVTQSIAAAMGILTGGKDGTKKQIDNETEDINKRAEELFNGTSDKSYEKARASLEEDVASLKETKAILEQGQSNYKEGSAGWLKFQDRIDKINSSLNTAESVLNTVTKTQYESIQNQRQLQQNKANVEDYVSQNKKLSTNYQDTAIDKNNNLNADKLGSLIDSVRKTTEDKNTQNNVIGQYLQNSSKTLVDQKASNQQIASSIQAAAQEMANNKMKPADIAAAINQGYGTNLTKKDVETTEEGEVKLNLDDSNLQKQLSNLQADVTANIVAINAAASGQNNPNSVFHRVGTMARGSRKGYTISGRPTLTGEEGEELVWEPRRNEAYMVGSNGPQFANISKNAVVWNAEQTKRIKKNSNFIGRIGTGARGITPIGTMAGGSGGGGSRKIPGMFDIDAMANIQDIKPPEEKPEIPVKAKLEVEGSSKGGLLNKIKGLLGKGDKNPSVKVTAEATKITIPEDKKNSIKVTGDITKLNNKAGKLKNVKATATVNKVVKGGKVDGEPINVKAKASVSADTGKVEKKVDKVASSAAKTQKMVIDANNGPAMNKINQVINRIKSSKPTLNYSVSGPSSVTVPVYASFRGSWEKTVKINKGGGGAKGINNKISHNHVPQIGSMASGRHGRLGPRGKGGPTLTGEKGFEIAWLPSESRSLILGANGPQMVDLPKDAVVWTNEQSKKILKQKAIPAGSHGNPSGRYVPGSSNNSNGGRGGRTGGGSKSGGNSGGDSGQSKKIGKKHIKILQRAGKINSWWWNMTKKVEATQRKIDSINKGIEKLLDRVGTTLDSISGEANKYIQALRDQIVLNTRMMDKANEKLNTMNTKKTSQRTKDAQKQVKQDRKKLDKAKRTDSKKDDKKAKKQLKKDKKKLRKTQKGVNWATISYDATKKITQKGKKTKKKKVTKKDRVNLSNFIFYNEEAQEYQIDDRAIKKKYGKSKKGQAVRDAAEKRLNNYIDKRNTAEDNINNAQDALDEIGQKLYESFFGWETELTRIWNITQKIAEAEGNRERAESFNELLDAQIADDTVKVFDEFGRTNFDYVNKIKGTFAKGVNEQIDAIKLTALSIGARVQDLQKTLSSADEEETLKNISRLVENSENYYDAMTNRAIAQGKLDDELEKRGTADDAVDKAKKKRQKLKDKLEDADTKKEKKKIKKQIKNAKKQVTEAKDARDKIYKKTEEAVQTQQTAIDEANSVMSGYSADEILDDTKTQAYKAYQKELEDEVEAIKLAHDYMNPQTRTDGTVSINFDSDAFEQDKQAGKFTSTTADKIQNYVKKIVDDSNDLRDTYKDLTDKLTELHTTLADLKEAWVGYSEDLMSILEEENEKELDKYKALSDSIREALDKLLDQVKKNLEERRRQEDNAKTERDISQKQQRLAALRADTSGGHQVEIAQLEKEIADAQLEYGRTLEDQLLDKLNDQAEAAAEQRERIIALEEALNTAVNNAAKVNAWMNNPEAYKEEMRQAFFTAKGWAEMPLPGQQALETQFNQLYMGLLTNQDKQAVLVDAINATTEEVQVVEGSLGAVGLINAANLGNTNLLESELKAIANKIDANVLQTKQNTEDLLQQAMQQAYENALGSSDQYSEEYIARVMAAAQPYIESGLKTEEDVYGDINLWTTDKSQYEYNTADLGRKDALNYANQNNLTGDFLYEDQYQRSIGNGKIGTGEYADLLRIGNQSTAELNKQLQDSGLSSKQTANAQLRYEKTQDDKVTKKEAKAIGKANGLTGKALDKWLKNKGYKKGGLANFTGPAWLDGTPSKPELVLNPTDTKNFIALRDVLGKTMGNIHNPNESLNNTMYEININVDHINSDYDVDKIAARIKKDIIKDAGYRNVTQVRNLR